MATINASRASSTLMSGAFFKSAVLLVVGGIVAQVMTGWMRSNVFDVPFQGGDALYPLVAAFLSLAVLPARWGRPIALGSTATSVRVGARELGLL